ncbi:MAG TPA: cupin domain-containing protein [Anaeromyxobacteraceae bacterium]
MPGGSRVVEVEWIARTADVAVRVNTLAPRQGTPWHHHTAVTDDVFCLEEPVEVGLRDPDETVALRPGQRQRIRAGRVHRVVNRSAAPARYLLVQATGPYDFVEVED